MPIIKYQCQYCNKIFADESECFCHELSHINHDFHETIGRILLDEEDAFDAILEIEHFTSMTIRDALILEQILLDDYYRTDDPSSIKVCAEMLLLGSFAKFKTEGN